jgi:succinate dehydrogenase/fumarate reductase flavoprotein subunit
VKEFEIMRHHKKAKNAVSRRSFIKGAALGVSAAVASGLQAGDLSAKSRQYVDKWDHEADVVIVGYGGAGAVAAITAHDAGARVLVMEKAPVEGGGSTRMSGGQSAYIEAKDAAGAAEYLYAGCFGTTPKDVCLAWAEEIAENDDWLTEMGIKWMDMKPPSGGGSRPSGKVADFPNFSGANAMKSLMINGGGSAFFKTVNDHIIKRGIKILFDTPATDLIQDTDTKEILGVKAKNKGKNINIKARKAVILCTGGFDFDEEMVKNYLRPIPIKFTGWKYNTGDGVKMAQAIGSDLWHMNALCSAGQVVVSPLSEIAWMYTRAQGPNFIWVNRYGRRFACESPSWFDHRASMGYTIWDWSDTQKDAGYPCIPFYLIFDEKTRLAGPIGGSFGSMGVTSISKELGGISEAWSKDNSREVEAGWIKRGGSVRELAALLGDDIDPVLLEDSVTRWNAFCAADKDQDFGRSEKLAPIETPPFYGLKMYPGGFNTLGGPRRNGKAQVLDTKKDPIPRLYSAGALGSIAGHIYCVVGHNWSELMSFGRIAGRNAAAEKPWS